MQLRFSKYLRQQIPILVALSLFPGLGYIVLGWIADSYWPAIGWYALNLGISYWGMRLYWKFDSSVMGRRELARWNTQAISFNYVFFAMWALIFLIYIRETASGLHYIAIFTQIGATTVAASFLYPVPRLFKPIIPLMMGLLAIYFFGIGEWYGYVLSIFATILGGVLFYAADSAHRLLLTTHRQATHDLLTGLHNRQFFLEELQQLMIDLRRTDGSAFLLLIDLDHFKTVNDSLGHDVGDSLLQEVALRLKQHLPANDILARLGGDEFIVISGIHDNPKECEKAVEQLAAQLLAAVKQTYVIDSHHIYISASIGVRIFSSQDEDSATLVREADIAMYEVKSSGRDGVFLFNKEMSRRVEQHLQIERLLHFAREKQEIRLCFQPLVDEEKRIVGAECLVRWQNDDLGNVPPDKFIPIAEQTGMIIDLGQHILDSAFQTLQAWHDQGIVLQQFSINISIRQLMHAQFVENVMSSCEQWLTPPLVDTLVFEITETVISEEVNRVIIAMERLQSLGVRFSMDDFGTGYSSLSYLQQLPVRELKIDQSFVRNIQQNAENRAMVTTILNIAQFLKLAVVVEGIEEEPEFNVLREMNCHRFQGYYFYHPLYSEDFKTCYLEQMKDLGVGQESGHV